MAYHSFEDGGMEAKLQDHCRVYDMFKNSKEYVLRDQMTRSALSIPSNIAEGAERSSSLEFIRFLNIAKGSAAELRTQLYIASEIGAIYITERNELIEISSMLQSLIRALKRKTNMKKQNLQTQNVDEQGGSH